MGVPTCRELKAIESFFHLRWYAEQAALMYDSPVPKSWY
jgi:hypothetical protein